MPSFEPLSMLSGEWHKFSLVHQSPDHHEPGEALLSLEFALQQNWPIVWKLKRAEQQERSQDGGERLFRGWFIHPIIGARLNHDLERYRRSQLITLRLFKWNMSPNELWLFQVAFSGCCRWFWVWLHRQRFFQVDHSSMISDRLGSKHKRVW